MRYIEKKWIDIIIVIVVGVGIRKTILMNDTSDFRWVSRIAAMNVCTTDGLFFF